MSEQRAEVAQSLDRVDAPRLRELSRAAVLAQDVTTVIRSLVDADFPYTLTGDDHTIFCANTVGVAVLLPLAASVPGREYVIKKITLAAATIVLTPAGSDQIEAAASFAFGAGARAVQIIRSDGVDWWLV